MPPRPKVTKEQIIDAALKIAKEKGIERITAREIGSALGVSSRPLFTYYESMDDLRIDVFKEAYDQYEKFISAALHDPMVFRSMGQHTLRFICEEPQLFKILCFSSLEDIGKSDLIGSHAFFENNYNNIKGYLINVMEFNEHDAKCFFRQLWIHTMGIGMLIVSGTCPYSQDELQHMMSEMCLAILKAYKDYPDLPTGKMDLGVGFRTAMGKEYGLPKE